MGFSNFIQTFNKNLINIANKFSRELLWKTKKTFHKNSAIRNK